MIFKNLLVLLCVIQTKLIAQDIQINSSAESIEQQVDYIFENVNFDEVENGILFEHGFPWVKFSNFQGGLTDQATSKLDFSLLYASLYAMALNDDVRLPEPEIYRTATDNVPDDQASPLLILHYNYYEISENAITDNLFTVTDNQLFDVPGRPSSPYVLNEVFLISPGTSVFRNGEVSLVFNEDLFFQNTDKNVEELAVDFADGNGWQILVPGIPETAIFESETIVNVKFRMTYSDARVRAEKF